MALSNNPGLRQSQIGRDSSELSIGAAKTEFQLSAIPQSGVTVDDSGDSQGFYGLRLSKRTGYGGEVVVSGSDDSLFSNDGGTSYTVSFSQALFRNAGALVNKENIVRAKQSLRSSERSLELRKASTVVAVVDAYEQVIRLEQQLKADQQALQRAESLLKLTRAKERLGRTTRIDTLRVQLQQGETVSRATNTKEQLSAARRILAELLGWNNALLPPLQPPALFTVDYVSLEQATETAFANRLEYAQAQQEHADSLRATRISKQQLKPALRVVAQYNHNDDPFNDINNFNTQNSWTVSLVSDTDLNRNREKLEYRQSLLQETRSLEDMRAQYLAIGREVEQALLAYERSHHELGILKGNLEHAQARLTLARKLFRVGRTDGFSVTDAEQAYFSAQSRWLNGRSEASINGYRLLQATGTLIESPSHLKPRAG